MAHPDPVQPRRPLRSLLLLLLLPALALAGCNGGGDSSAEPIAPVQCTEASVVNTAAPGTDPLAGELWFLNNTQQTAYASTAGSTNEDINYGTPAQTGSGVKVAIVDTGLEIGHEDLVNNVQAGGSWDFVQSDTDPSNPSCGGDHGTSVAGLVGAEMDNGLGGHGVAPAATLVGYNYLLNQSTANLTNALGGATGSPFKSDDVMVFNQSYGYQTNYDFTADTTVENQYIYGVTTLRGGKGALYVKSAGNGYFAFGAASCPSSDISCQNANFDPYNAMPWNIVVGAVNAKGLKSTYSTAGSAVWVSAPGGEYGYNYSFDWNGYSWNPPPANPDYIFEPAMITTDRSGCNRGYSLTYTSPLPKNDFEDGLDVVNPTCNYTSAFNGTSSAAPVTTGVIALLLQAKPGLTWRDVKHILATTADQIDMGLGGAGAGSFTLGDGSYLAEPGWITNAATLTYSNWYGFGRINVASALTAAGGYTLGSLGTFTDTNWVSSGALSKAIPDDSKTGVTDTITVNTSGTMTFVEAVQIKVSISHGNVGSLGIELLSPGGTTSVLFTIFNGFWGTAHLDQMVLLSNAFYSETTVDGAWTIKVVDGAPGTTGTLTNWRIRIHGH